MLKCFEAVMGIYPWLPTGSEQSVQCGLRVVFIVLTHGHSIRFLVFSVRRVGCGKPFLDISKCGVVVIIMLME